MGWARANGDVIQFKGFVSRKSRQKFDAGLYFSEASQRLEFDFSR
jgi:hypothetical protein